MRQIEDERGITPGLLNKWKQRYQLHPVTGEVQASDQQDLEAENRRLRRELALVVDSFSRTIAGWALDTQLETSLVEQALRMDLAQRQPVLGQLLHHSDWDGQYASGTCQQLLAAYDSTASMSRTADPYDKALMENCIGTLKTECAEQHSPSRQIARSELFADLEGWYNRRHLHSALGCLRPDQFEHPSFEDKLSLHSEG